MIETFVGVLLALLARDVIRYAAGMLEWRWSGYRGNERLRVRVARLFAGEAPRYGR